METVKTEKRIEYIDIARGLAILLVVLGHWLPSDSGTVRKMIYAFHMPLFFVISGLVLKIRDADFTGADLGKLILRRFYGYYVPYVIWALFYTTLGPGSLLYVLYGTREALKAVSSVTSLWFLPALMVADIMAECILFLIRKREKKKILIAVFMVITAAAGFVIPHPETLGYPLGLDVALMGCAFMLLGCLLRPVFTRCSEKLAACLLFSILLCLAFTVVFFRYPITIGTVYMFKTRYGAALPFLANSVLGSAAVIMCACFLDRLLPRKKLLVTVGTSTLVILVLHKPMIKYVKNMLKGIGYEVNRPNIPVLLGCIALVLLCTLLTQLLLKIAPFLLGKATAERKPSDAYGKKH